MKRLRRCFKNAAVHSAVRVRGLLAARNAYRPLLKQDLKIKTAGFLILAAHIGMAHASARLPLDFEQTTYVDCVSPENPLARLRITGKNPLGSSGEIDTIILALDSEVLISEPVTSHAYTAKEETYQSSILTLTLERNSGGPIYSRLTSQSTGLPSRIFSCRELR